MDSVKLSKLKGSKDWELWRVRIRALLAKKGYIETIKPKKEFPKGSAKETIEAYIEERREASIKAAAIIRLNLDDGPLIQTKNVEEDNAEKLYSRLETLYEPKGFSSEFLIAKELFSTTLARSENSIERYLTRIRSLTDDLAAKDKAIPTEIIAAYTLNNLTSEYDYIVAAINQTFRNEEEIDLDDLFSTIIDESRRIEAKKPNHMALNTQNKVTEKKRKPLKCYKCQGLGHIARNCRRSENSEAIEL